MKGAATLTLAVLAFAAKANAEPGLDALLASLADNGRFSGAVVLMEGGRERYARGFGWADQKARRPFTPDTPSDGGSIAKPMTAAAILRLSTTGKLDLDAPAKSLVPEFPHPGTTLRQLLAHSAGLPDHGAFQPLLEAGTPVSTHDLLVATSRQQPQPAFPPGTAFDYCNLCYDSLGAALEVVHHRPYRDLIRTEVLLPAGATTAFARPARLSDWPVPRTIGYSSAAPGALPLDQLDNEGFYGASNMMVSTRDLAAFAQSWLTGPLHGIRAAAIEPVTIGGKRSEIRLGSWYCNSSATTCHYSGHHQGFDTFAAWNSATEQTAAFVSNGGLAPWDLHRLQRAMVDSSAGRPVSMPAAHPACLATTPPSSLVGRYRTQAGTVAIEADGERLMLATDGHPPVQLFHIAPGTHYAPGLDVFLCLDQGTTLLWFNAYADLQGERIPTP